MKVCGSILTVVSLGSPMSFVSSGTLCTRQLYWCILTVLLLATDLVRCEKHRTVVSSLLDFCETESMNATCDPGEVVLMTHALYGRMKLSRCVKLDYGHVGCASDVLELSDTRCSGRRKCEIRIPDALFGTKKPCPDDLKPYLEGGYKCVKVETPTTDACEGLKNVHVSSPSGYLANLVTEATGCGSLNNPWVIEAKPGQNLNIVLYDFNVAFRKQGKFSYPHCQMYAVVRERLPTGTRNVTVCGGMSRHKVVYTSTTNRVEIGIVRSEDQLATPYFMLRYQAVGCPDLPSKSYSWSVRNGNAMMVKCNFTKDVFNLKCDGEKWTGDVGNCSKSISMGKINRVEYEEYAIPYGLSILIVLAIALIIGLFVLFVGLMFLKKRQQGPCGRQMGSDSECSRTVDEADKDYVRDAWIRTQHESPSHTLYAKHTPWREPEYSTYAAELPPCTPLMNRGQKTTIYGQVAPKLPCGCNAYVDNVDLGDYTTRPQLSALGSGRNEKIVLRPGDHSHYFIYSGDGAAVTANSCAQDCSSSCQGSVQDPVRQGQPQTDDIKLRLRTTDSPSSGSSKSNSGISPDRKPLMSGDREHCHCDDYAGVYKEKKDNEVNDNHQRKPPYGDHKS